MKKRLKNSNETWVREVIFYPAVTPMEAAVIPAREKMRYGALRMAPHAWEALEKRENQRAKIWVR